MRLLIASCLIAPVAFAAPLSKVKSAPYYPTRVGDTLVYEVTDVGPPWEFTLTVDQVEIAGGALIVTTVGKNRPGSTVRVSGAGVSRTAFGGRALAKPADVLRLPASAGATWEAGPDPGLMVTRHVCTVIGEEDVTVPAGTYRAVRVDETLTHANGVTTASVWHAPNVGVVKVVSKGQNLTATKELKSFKPGK